VNWKISGRGSNWPRSAKLEGGVGSGAGLRIGSADATVPSWAFWLWKITFEEPVPGWHADDREKVRQAVE